MSAAQPRRGGVTTATKASSAVGAVAAVVAAVLLNVVVARHYQRWDWTSAKLYSLSAPTKETLHSLGETVEITVLLSAGDPLTISVRHLLAAYRAETDHLVVRYLDPDKNPGDFLAFQQKYDLLAGRTEDGRIVADAAVVVTKGERRWFLTPTDLVDVSEAEEGKARPKLEQGLTTAIRRVLSGERARACFSKGHGELSPEEAGPHGLGELRHRLERNNIDLTSLDTTAPNVPEQPWQGCDLALVASPQQPFAAQEAHALGAYLQNGGGLLLLLNPTFDPEKKRPVPSGLDSVAALGGIELRSDLLFERDSAWRLPSGRGEAFFGQPKPHPITEGLLGPRAGGARMLFVLSRSLGPRADAPVRPAELVVTSSEAFGRLDFLNGPETTGEVEPRSNDRRGPLAVALAAELPAAPGAAHGPRLVVVGTGSVAQGQAWQEPALRGGALFMESAISWITSKPQLVDVPAKPAQPAGLRLTEESFRQVRNYVVFYIPTAVALVGLAVFLRRRSTEGHPRPRKESEGA